MRHRHRYLPLCLLPLLANCGPAPRDNSPTVTTLSPQAVKLSQFTQRAYTTPDGYTMRYALYAPPDAAQKNLPLILWLHGAGSRGDDFGPLLNDSDQHGLGYLARPDAQARFPAIIAAPQLPRTTGWGRRDGSGPTPERAAAWEILEHTRREFNADASRLYVMGVSMGGFAAWAMITEHPGAFAAAVPICGGGDTTKAAAIKDTPVWAFHGDQDDTVGVEYSRTMIDALKKAGGQPKYTEFKGVGHNSWEPAFKEPELLNWLFRQQRARR
jgi:predicted peptidase